MDKLRNDERMLIYKLLYDNALTSIITELKTITEDLVRVNMIEKFYKNCRYVKIIKCIYCRYCWTWCNAKVNKKCARCINGIK